MTIKISQNKIIILTKLIKAKLKKYAPALKEQIQQDKNNIISHELLELRESIVDWLDKCKIKNYKIIASEKYDYIVDVDGPVNFMILGKKIGVIPVKFNCVNGDFICAHSGLTTLEHCPDIVNGIFSCAGNDLTSMKGCPKKITGSVHCSFNNLTNLKYCPEIINGMFDCSINKLTDLEFAPKYVHGDFNCSHNKISSLKHCPTIINGSFSCNDNKLTSLLYCHEVINGTFDVSFNQLTSLEFCPKKITNSFFCNNNKLKDLVYFPQEIFFVIRLEGNNFDNELAYRAVLFEDAYKIHLNDSIAAEKEKLEHSVQLPTYSNTTNKIKI